MDVRRQKKYIRNKLENLQWWAELCNNSKGTDRFWESLDVVGRILDESVNMLKDYQQSIENGYIDPRKARI